MTRRTTCVFAIVVNIICLNPQALWAAGGDACDINQAVAQFKNETERQVAKVATNTAAKKETLTEILESQAIQDPKTLKTTYSSVKIDSTYSTNPGASGHRTLTYKVLKKADGSFELDPGQGYPSIFIDKNGKVMEHAYNHTVVHISTESGKTLY